ncbi:MAG: hypothetical protein ACRDAG_01085 [Cetobacterium somerae]|uniref:hypothetical protein n=1 Tax=Cetobacterium somerae TaxID=188913 RepID=UPI003F3CA203
MSRTPYLDLNIPDKSSKGFVVTDVFEPNFTKLDQEAERVNLRKMSTEDNIEELKNATRYNVGDVVEVLGYYSAGDGARHPRQKKATGYNGSDAVIGADGSIWGIVHNGNVEACWFGANADRTDNDIFIQKAISCDGVVDVSLSFKIYKTSNVIQIFSNKRLGEGVLVGLNYTKPIIQAFDGVYKLSKLQLEYENYEKIEENSIGIRLKNAYMSVFNDIRIWNVYRGIESKEGYTFSTDISDINVGNYKDCALYLKSDNTESTGTTIRNIYTQTRLKDDNTREVVRCAFDIGNQTELTMIQANSEWGNFTDSCFVFEEMENANITAWHIEGVSFGDALFKIKNVGNFNISNGTCMNNFELKNGNSVISLYGEKNGVINFKSNTSLNNKPLDVELHYLKRFDGTEKNTRSVVFENVCGWLYKPTSQVTPYEFYPFNSGSNEKGGDESFKILTKIRAEDLVQKDDKREISVDVAKSQIIGGAVVENTGVFNTMNMLKLYKNNSFNQYSIWGNVLDCPVSSGTLLTFKREDDLKGSVQMAFDHNSFYTRFVFSESNAPWIKVSGTGVQQLDTPYHATQMSKLGILDSYHQYLTELHEYEKSQNAQSDAGVMNLNVIQQPVIPTKVEAYAKEYNLI